MCDGSERLATFAQIGQPAQVVTHRAGQAVGQTRRHQPQVEVSGQRTGRRPAKGLEQLLEASGLQVDVGHAITPGGAGVSLAHQLGTQRGRGDGGVATADAVDQPALKRLRARPHPALRHLVDALRGALARRRDLADEVGVDVVHAGLQHAEEARIGLAARVAGSEAPGAAHTSARRG